MILLGIVSIFAIVVWLFAWALCIIAAGNDRER